MTGVQTCALPICRRHARRADDAVGDTIRVTTTRGRGRGAVRGTARRCRDVPRRAAPSGKGGGVQSVRPAGAPSPSALRPSAGGPRACARTRAARARERELGVGWLVAPTAATCECRADRGSGRTDRDASSRAGPTPPVTCSRIVPPYAPAVGQPSGGFDAFCLWGWDHAYFAPRYIGPAIIVLNSRGSIFTSAPQAWSLGPLGFRTLIVVSFCFNI